VRQLDETKYLEARYSRQKQTFSVSVPLQRVSGLQQHVTPTLGLQR
jgi:hypothetical protein